MFNSLESFLALRYLRPRRGHLFVSLISFASVLGITLCVAVLITTISIMNGLGNEMRTRLVGLSSHITVSTKQDSLTDWEQLANRAAQAEGVVGVAPFVEGQGMVVNGASLNGTLISGVIPRYEESVSVLADAVVNGDFASLRPASNNILIDSQLAYAIDAVVGDKLTLMIPRPTADGTGVLPLMRRFTVSGVFEAGVPSNGSARSVIHMSDAIELFNLSGAQGLHLKLADLMSARATADSLARQLGDSVSVADWTRQQARIFRAIKIEKVMMSILLLLAVAVAAFNINAMLMMVVSEKRTDIAVLRTLGMTPARITRVFLTQGSVIAVGGVLLGTVLGVIVAYNAEWIVAGVENFVGRKLFRADVFYVTNLPSEVRWAEVVIISLSSLLLAVASTLYPSKRAAAIEPAEALRYE